VFAFGHDRRLAQRRREARTRLHESCNRGAQRLGLCPRLQAQLARQRSTRCWSRGLPQLGETCAGDARSWDCALVDDGGERMAEGGDVGRRSTSSRSFGGCVIERVCVGWGSILSITAVDASLYALCSSGIHFGLSGIARYGCAVDCRWCIMSGSRASTSSSSPTQRNATHRRLAIVHPFVLHLYTRCQNSRKPAVSPASNRDDMHGTAHPLPARAPLNTRSPKLYASR
jgi:hypothetical protein